MERDDEDVHSVKPLSADLLRLEVGSLSLTPSFAKVTTEYTATTSNAKDQIRVAPENVNATVLIKVGGTTEVANGGDANWSVGSNTLTVTVTSGQTSKTYTVTVTRSSGT